MNVGEMQRKLSLWATQDKERKLYGLYDLLYDEDWLRLAHDYVKQNAGSTTAGCDGINMALFDENLENNLQTIGEELKSETFKPDPVRRVYIPKPNGKTRPLGIPAIKDRIVQEALRMALEPIFEADFSQYSLIPPYPSHHGCCSIHPVEYHGAEEILLDYRRRYRLLFRHYSPPKADTIGWEKSER
jgi:RNA-directed DNA polymerase